MANSNETAKVTLVRGGAKNAWVKNPGDVNPKLANAGYIRFDKVFTDEQIVKMLNDASIVDAALRINKTGYALAIPENRSLMAVGIPSSQFPELKSGGSTIAGLAKWAVHSVVSQVAEMVTRAVSFEARNKPAFGGKVSDVSVDASGNGTFTLTCKNGQVFRVSVSEFNAPATHSASSK